MNILKHLLICILLLLLLPSSAFSQPDWQISMRIQSGDARSDLILGADNTATDGFDNLWETYAFLAGGIKAYFPHSEWNMAQDIFWRDIKSQESGATKTWPFTVDIDPASSLLNQTFTITWDFSMIPQDYTATLTDDSTGQQIDMRATPSYQFIFAAARNFSVAVNIPSCITLAVRVVGAGAGPFSSIQTAYNGAANNDLIQSHNATLPGDVNLNLTKTVTIDGGFDCDYLSNAGATTINGNLTISDGTVTIGNIILQ